MSRFATLVIAILVGVAAFAPAAEAVPSCISAGNVTGLGADGCNLNGLNFSDFIVSPGGVAAAVLLGTLSKTTGTTTDLTFQVAHDPSPANLGDILMYYTVQSLTNAALTGLTLFNPGSNVTIREHACDTPFNNGLCQGTELANLIATGGGDPQSATFAGESTVYVRKDIQLLQNSFISEFTNRHDTDLAPTPEPATLLLLGSSLAGAGLAMRRRARRAGNAAVADQAA